MLLRKGGVDNLKPSNAVLEYTIEKEAAAILKKVRLLKHLVPKDCLVGPQDRVPGIKES